MGKSASFNPDNMGAGGALPDGRYTIKAAQCIEFDYDGKAAAVPALELVLHDGTADYSQKYSAGKLDNLVPSEDGEEFVHPGGGDAIINKKSNLGVFMTALRDTGFPMGELTEKCTSLVGLDLDIVNKAQDKRPGLKDQAEGKTIPLPVKYHGRVKVGAKGARPPARSAAPASKGTTAPAAATASAQNGDLDADAITRVQEVLAGADGPLVKVKVAMAVRQGLAGDANQAAIGKLVAQDQWLKNNSEVGGWVLAEGKLSLA